MCSITTDLLRAKYAMSTPDANLGSFKSWDSVLGERWDVLPGEEDGSLDTAIRTMRFQEVREFGFSLVKCHLNMTEGRFQCDEDYRLVIRHNANEAALHDCVGQ